MSFFDDEWLDSFGSGGSRHATWERIEDIGKAVINYGIPGETKTPEQLAAEEEKKDEYTRTQNQESGVSKYATKQNLTYLGIAAIGILLFKGA